MSDARAVGWSGPRAMHTRTFVSRQTRCPAAGCCQEDESSRRRKGQPTERWGRHHQGRSHGGFPCRLKRFESRVVAQRKAFDLWSLRRTRPRNVRSHANRRRSPSPPANS